LRRYRLRFLLQEIDLAPGDTVIGRSAGCRVTIEDPLVSRQHACIHVSKDGATIEDLGSRNGLLVNGRVIHASQSLGDGDRIRIGTQEMVFCEVRGSVGRKTGPMTRPTGFMCHCASCGLPYPAELVACPSCGSDDRVDEDTLNGVTGESERDWTLELLIEVLDKALALERWDDVERMLQRVRLNVEDRIAKGEPIERANLDRLADAAAQLAVQRKQAEWGAWLLAVHAELALIPRLDVTRSLSTLPPSERSSLAPAAGRVIERARGGPGWDADGASGVEALTGTHAEGG
jgi:FHA domain